MDLAALALVSVLGSLFKALLLCLFCLSFRGPVTHVQASSRSMAARWARIYGSLFKARALYRRVYLVCLFNHHT